MPTATEAAFRKAMTARAFASVYYLHGDDDFRKDEAVAQALDAIVSPEFRAFDLDLRQASSIDAESLVTLLETPPLGGVARAVAIRDVGALKKDARRELDQYLERPSDRTILFLVASAGGKADKSLTDAAVSVEFPALTGDGLPKWIAFRASELDVGITDEAAALLQEAVGPDLAALSAELDKLASYVRGAAPGGTGKPRGSAKGHGAAEHQGGKLEIDETAVGAVVGVRRGETLGDLLDRIAARDLPGALAMIDHVLGQPKVSAVGVVMALSTQTLALAWGKSRREQGVPASRLNAEFFNMLKETGANPMRPWGEAVSSWVRNVDRWTPEAVERSLRALARWDTALKDTRVSSDEQAIESLVLELCADESALAARPMNSVPAGAGA